jgi:AraC-like DNA-binding protein
MALQSLFLGLALIGRPDRRSHANLALAIASFAFGLAMGHDIVSFFTDGRIALSATFWAATKLPILFILPFAYLHMVGLTSGSSWRFSPRDAWHGMFCVAGCLVFAVGAIMDSPLIERQLQYGIYAVSLIQGGYYLISGFRLSRRNDSPQSAWLRLLLWGLTGFLVVHGVINAVGYAFGNVPWARVTAHLSALGLLYAIAWGSLSHSAAFQKLPDQVFRELVAAPLEKYRKSRQSAQEAQRILAKLDHAVLTESLYREADLTLPMLAAKVGAKPNIVSQALNQTLGVSFFDYINNHRISEAKRLLLTADETDVTILDIAYAVGFNSKSTFNAAFKKRTGQTPSLFRKQAYAGTSL